MISAPTREALQARSLLPFRTGRNWTKADLFLWEEEGARLAVKDFAAKPRWVRNTLGRLVVGRECAAYARLSGIDGIPRLAGRVDAYAFAVGFVEGRDLSHFHRGEVPAVFFDRLLHLLDAVHGAGVAHGDLHHRDVLQDPRGLPFLVDFSTAMFREPGAGFLRQRLFEMACASDHRAALKLKRRHAPRSLTPEENRVLDHPPSWYRIGRSFRVLVGRGGRR